MKHGTKNSATAVDGAIGPMIGTSRNSAGTLDHASWTHHIAQPRYPKTSRMAGSITKSGTTSPRPPSSPSSNAPRTPPASASANMPT